MEWKRSLLEIFLFYCNKFLEQSGTFEALAEKKRLLGMRGYHAFCKDFKLPVSSAKVTEIWKKASVNHQPHTFDQFFESMS